jgi:ATP-binding cassette subfamily B multidrug efflux pump
VTAHASTAAEAPTLGGHFRRHLPAYVAGAVFLGGFQLAMNRIDWLSKAAIDGVFSGHGGRAIHAASIMLGLAVIAFFTRIASRYYVFNAGRDVEYELRGALLAKLHDLGSAFYRRMSAGEIMSRATNDLGQVRLLFGFGILNVVNVVFAFASALQVMIGISWRLTLAASVMVPIVVVTTRGFSRQLFVRTRKNQESLGRLAALVQGNLAGVRVVRSFALEAREMDRFRATNEEYLEASLSLARLRGSMGPTLGAASAAGVLLFFWYGGLLLLRPHAAGGITKGDFFAFNLALARMTWPIIALGFAYSILQRGRACFARLEEIFHTAPEIDDVGRGAPAGNALEVRGLSFAYGDNRVLRDVSFAVPAGRSLAIVGRTGAGKSTLAQLLVRLLPTPRGTVLVGGVDACDLPLEVLRHRLGYAQQDAFLFSTTVSRNIGFSIDDPDGPEAMERIRAAAREAQVLQEALELPEKLDTVVGERGVQLSGGQRQRIALARALAWEPPILLLDDPLSAVDAKTEAQILEALERQAKERTLLLVTHRVAAAAMCDEIVVLDGGRVVARGTHDELVRRGGLYATFAEEQRAARELEELEASGVASRQLAGVEGGADGEVAE